MDQQKITLALFDFDGTMISGDSIVPFLAHALKRGDLSFWGYLKGVICGVFFLLKMMDGGKAKKKALAFYKRLSHEKRKALDQSFAEENLLPRIYPGAKEALFRHQQEGKHALLVSASTENYMQYAAKALKFDGLLCTPVDRDGNMGENCHGEEKVRRIHAYLKEKGMQADFENSFAYGDSKGDLPMLSLCGNAIQVNGKKSMEKAAPDMQKVCWKIG